VNVAVDEAREDSAEKLGLKDNEALRARGDPRVRMGDMDVMEYRDPKE